MISHQVFIQLQSWKSLIRHTRQFTSSQKFKFIIKIQTGKYKLQNTFQSKLIQGAFFHSANSYF